MRPGGSVQTLRYADCCHTARPSGACQKTLPKLTGHPKEPRLRRNRGHYPAVAEVVTHAAADFAPEQLLPTAARGGRVCFVPIEAN